MSAPATGGSWVGHALLGAAVLATVAGLVWAQLLGAGPGEWYFLAALLLVADAVWLATRKPRSRGRIGAAVLLVLAACALGLLGFVACWAAELGGDRCWIFF